MSYNNCYHDKRLLVDHPREPKENEFVFHEGVVFDRQHLGKIFNYIEGISDVRIEWIPKKNFINQSMDGVKVTIKGDGDF